MMDSSDGGTKCSSSNRSCRVRLAPSLLPTPLTSLTSLIILITGLIPTSLTTGIIDRDSRKIIFLSAFPSALLAVWTTTLVSMSVVFALSLAIAASYAISVV
jgi:hypothetical protein